MSLRLERLLRDTIRRQGLETANLAAWEEAPIQQGHSGARVQRYRVTLRTPEAASRSLVVKDVTEREWRVLARLDHQRLKGVPGIRARLDAGGRALVCMEDAGERSLGRGAAAMEAAADALAGVHARNIGRQPAWLPRLGGDFAHDFVLRGCWQEAWAWAKGQDRFVTAFSDLIPRVEAAATRLPEEFAALCNQERYLTVVHGDLHEGHLLEGSDGRPLIIDWGCAAFGPLFLDLPLVFPTTRAAEGYRRAMDRHGLAVTRRAFLIRYRIAARLAAFRYMRWPLWRWTESGDASSGRQLRRFMRAAA